MGTPVSLDGLTYATRTIDCSRRCCRSLPNHHVPSPIERHSNCFWEEAQQLCGMAALMTSLVRRLAMVPQAMPRCRNQPVQQGLWGISLCIRRANTVILSCYRSSTFMEKDLRVSKVRQVSRVITTFFGRHAGRGVVEVDHPQCYQIWAKQ